MIGLITYGIVIAWIVVAVFISRRVAGKFKVSPVNQKWRFRLVFIFVLLMPFADEMIGRLQFHHLCDTQAKVWVSPDWRQVRRVIEHDLPTRKLGIFEGYVIPINLRQTEYYDKDTGKLFSSETSFSTYGGVLMRPEGGLGLGLGLGTQCWPPNWISAHREINLSQLLIKGE